MANWIKILLTLSLLLTGAITIQKLKNDVCAYEVIYRFLKFIILGFRKSAMSIIPKFEVTSDNNVANFKQKNTVKLDTIWTNSTYWPQKQAYEKLFSKSYKIKS